jgi:hypothetical protein
MSLQQKEAGFLHTTQNQKNQALLLKARGLADNTHTNVSHPLYSWVSAGGYK